MATDPYAAPRAHVADALPDGAGAEFVPGGQRVAAGEGWTWIAEGFELFRRQPGMWIALFLVFVVVAGVAGMIPFVGSVATIVFGPVLSAGIVIGTRTLDRGGELEIAHLFAGFREKTGALVAVGALYLAGLAVLMVAVFLVAGAGAAAVFMGIKGGVDTGSIGAGAVMGLLLAVLVAVALSIPLVMAIWFAAPLVVFHDLAPVEAMKASFAGCLKNLWPFLLYGLVVVVLSVLATLPLLLGWLVLGPVLAASFYTSYRGIFTAR